MLKILIVEISMPLAIIGSNRNRRFRCGRIWLACSTAIGPFASEPRSRRLRRPALRCIELTLSPQPSRATAQVRPSMKNRCGSSPFWRRGLRGGLLSVRWLAWTTDHSSIRALPRQSGDAHVGFPIKIRVDCPISGRAPLLRTAQPMVGPSSSTRITIDLPSGQS
jgi:hypothetical protein